MTSTKDSKLVFHLGWNNQNMQWSIEEFMVESGFHKSTSFLMGLGPLEAAACRLLIVLNVLCGTLYRLLIVKFIRKQGFLQLPINAMTLVKEIAKSDRMDSLERLPICNCRDGDSNGSIHWHQFLQNLPLRRSDQQLVKYLYWCQHCHHEVCVLEEARILGRHV